MNRQTCSIAYGELIRSKAIRVERTIAEICRYMIRSTGVRKPAVIKWRRNRSSIGGRGFQRLECIIKALTTLQSSVTNAIAHLDRQYAESVQLNQPENDQLDKKTPNGDHESDHHHARESEWMKNPAETSSGTASWERRSS